ncbi:helix-turn-helix transcriptional regulator [Fulvivirga maritima]|uniref:helix-turn-helix domain-containing protein n=1 Tax=Fulvivirga maritima TaxID=2904247 RepID=UPI001F4129DF|nr:helix-turn-helix transcriptional regulator [Fulvivirga maritima]UII27550.1 helix-turn-helix transcriptional regulator [Fulvivirga maritima]
MSKNQEYINAFGKHLKKLREQKGLTQEELSNRSGQAFSQIGRFERGVRSPTLSTLIAIANGLDVHPKKLLDFDF